MAGLVDRFPLVSEAVGLLPSTLYTELLVHTAVSALGVETGGLKVQVHSWLLGCQAGWDTSHYPSKVTTCYSLHFNDVQLDIPRKKGISTKLCFPPKMRARTVLVYRPSSEGG